MSISSLERSMVVNGRKNCFDLPANDQAEWIEVQVNSKALSRKQRKRIIPKGQQVFYPVEAAAQNVFQKDPKANFSSKVFLNQLSESELWRRRQLNNFFKNLMATSQ